MGRLKETLSKIKVKKPSSKDIKSTLTKGLHGYKQKKLLILLASLPIPVVIGLVTFYVGAKSSTVVAFTSLGFIGVVLPYIAYEAWEFKTIKKAEDSFPNFLRDISQATSAGMTLPQAIKTSSKIDYGDLNPYVKKLNIWLSWGMPFPKAWKRFTKSLERSVLIKRINAIVLEAFHSGGNLKATLESLADDVSLLKQMEAERKSIMKQQIMIMYIVFFIFVGVVISLYKILSPILYIQQIGLFSGVSLKAGVVDQLSIDYFKNLFFLMALVEGISAGLIAGQIAEERIVAGFKHILIMVSVSVFLFFMFVFPTVFNMEVSSYPPTVAPNGKVTLVGQVFYESSPAASATITIIDSEGVPSVLFSDNVGEFKKTIEAPATTGAYDIKITAEYKGETQIAVRSFDVV